MNVRTHIHLFVFKIHTINLHYVVSMYVDANVLNHYCTYISLHNIIIYSYKRFLHTCLQCLCIHTFIYVNSYMNTYYVFNFDVSMYACMHVCRL